MCDRHRICIYVAELIPLRLLVTRLSRIDILVTAQSIDNIISSEGHLHRAHFESLFPSAIRWLLPNMIWLFCWSKSRQSIRINGQPPFKTPLWLAGVYSPHTLLRIIFCDLPPSAWRVSVLCDGPNLVGGRVHGRKVDLLVVCDYMGAFFIPRVLRLGYADSKTER